MLFRSPTNTVEIKLKLDQTVWLWRAPSNISQADISSPASTPACSPAARRCGQTFVCKSPTSLTISLQIEAFACGAERRESGRGCMSRRVAITGIGAVSPNGLGREAFWKATKEGRSGVRRIASFDPAILASQIAGEVRDFDESLYVAPKRSEERRVGKECRL